MTYEKSTCIGFAPSIDSACTHLILGSMPGVTSLEKQQYYAHPQNRFWPLMSELLEKSLQAPTNYEDRLQMLLRHHIALWDSIDRCERNGSLDTAIHKVEANDFASFLQEYPKLHTICFNGAKSYQTFKHFNKMLLQRTDFHFFPLPSTSPANARWHMEALLNEWSKAIQ